MNDERYTRRTDRRNARTNTGRAAAPGTLTQEAEPTDGPGATVRHRRGGSRADSIAEGEATPAERSDEAGSDDRNGAPLPASIYREGGAMAASAPSRSGIEDYLHELYRNTPPVDGVIVLTTERSATELLEGLLTGAGGKRAPIGIIDTRSAGQYVEDVYRESPVHYTTADGDIERTAMSVVDLVGALSTSPAGRVNLIVDSYGALCESLSPGDRGRLLSTFHSQIDGYRIFVTDDCDEALEQWVDGAVRIERDAEKGIETCYERP